MIRAATRRARPGFTLVELMVAAAVCVLIMAVLATAFQMGIDTMRSLKSTGDLMDQLRGASTSLRADLQARHFLTSAGTPEKLSDFRWDQVQIVDNGATATPRFTIAGFRAPENGFFRVGSAAVDGTANVYEDKDADGLASARYTNHYLHFTAILEGKSDEDYYAATVRGKTYRSIAAEVAYFLDPRPSGSINGTTNLYRLVRRQRLVALNDTDRRDRPWPPGPATGEDRTPVLSLRQPATGGPPFYLNTLAEVRQPENRLGGNHIAGTQVGPGYAPTATPVTPVYDDRLAAMELRPGEDTLLSNVISFEVQLVYTYPQTGGLNAGLPVVPGYPRQFGTAGTNATQTSDHPFDTLPPNKPTNGPNTAVAAGVYDSWDGRWNNWAAEINQTTGVVNASANVPPVLARVQAVQIRIRIWDPKYQGARQVTIVQDL